jgi:futalosine hydrolase
MSFKILYVTASIKESEALKKIPGIIYSSDVFRLGTTEIRLLVTGVGSVSTAWALKDWLSVNIPPDLILNGGIAGSYNPDIKIGDVVLPLSDCFADSGIEDGENFLTLFETGLAGKDDFPFSSGQIYADRKYSDQLTNNIRPVRAITVNTATGSDLTMKRLLEKFNPDIETMEGATFFYICRRENLHFLAIRAISNIVEHRNRDKWNIPLALNNLSEKLKEIIVTLE